MNLWRRSTNILLFVLAFVEGLSTFTIALAQDKIAADRSQTLTSTYQFTSETLSKGTIANNIALERYQFAKRLERQFGFFPLWQSFDISCTLLFPAGRSDRVYILSRGANFFSTETGNITFFCYQRKDNGDKLVYRLKLEGRPSKQNAKIKSLITYLNSYAFAAANKNGHEVEESYVVTGKIRNFAKHDLALERDYVQYNYIPYSDTLEVWLLSDLNGNHLPEKDKITFYNLDKDLVTNAKLKPGEFYKKFGLPETKAGW